MQTSRVQNPAATSLPMFSSHWCVSGMQYLHLCSASLAPQCMDLMLQRSAVQRSAAQHSTAQHSTAQQRVTKDGMKTYSMAGSTATMCSQPYLNGIRRLDINPVELATNVDGLLLIGALLPVLHVVKKFEP